ncbi:MAG: hypothetical protein Q8Q12_13080 [bacterium]|nr:hypothetical protein [bacterium]
MKRRRCVNLLWSWVAVVVLLAACQCSRCWATQEASSKDVEAKIEVGVAAAKADEAMNAREPVKALKLLLGLVKKYPGNVSALHKYYDFLLKHRIKLSDSERAAALEYAKTSWPDVETLEDVFLAISREQGIKELFARVADDDAALTRAFTELESAFRDNDFKSLAFYAYVATAHADKPIAHQARLDVADLLLRCREYETAWNDFTWNFLDVAFTPDLRQRVSFSRAKCWEGLGKTKEAVSDYRAAWSLLPDSEMGLSAAERMARIALDQGNRTEVASWCLQMKSAKPSRAFSDRSLNDFYSEQMASVRRYSDRLMSSLERETAATPVPAEEQDSRKQLLAHLGSLTNDSAEQGERERFRSLKSRSLLTISAGVVDVLADPSAIAQRAEDLGQAAAALRPRRVGEPASTLDQALLEANDAVIASALREALVKYGEDGMNGDRLAAAYLYYGTTRDGGGRTQVQQLVSSLSKDVPGLEQLYSSREVTEKIASVAKSARLFEQARSEYRELLEQGIASAAGAASLKELAGKAQSVGNRDLGVRALERIRARFANEVDTAELTYLLAEAYFQNSEWNKAKDSFAAYIKQEAKDEARRMEAEYLSAMCDLYAEDYRQAALGLFGFAERYPKHGSAPNAHHLGLVSCSRYAESRGVPLNQRKEFLLRLAEDFPDTEMTAEAHYHFACLALDEDKNYAGALEHFKIALSGRRSDAAAFHIALCHEKLGDLRGAERWYRTVVSESRYGGARERARQALERFRSSSPEGEN